MDQCYASDGVVILCNSRAWWRQPPCFVRVPLVGSFFVATGVPQYLPDPLISRRTAVRSFSPVVCNKDAESP